MYSRYPDIANVNSDKIIDKIKEIRYAGKWHVSEKIHGGNLAMYIDTKTHNVSFSTRDEELDNNDKFYNFKSVIENINPDIEKLCENLKNAFKEYGNRIIEDYHTIAIYGELFGGVYNHPDVQRNTKAQKVQKGIYYTPNNYWLVFDIILLRKLTIDEIDKITIKKQYWEYMKEKEVDPVRLENIENNINSLRSFLQKPYRYVLNYFKVKEILKDTNLQMPPTIGIYDSLDECLAIDNKFESKVYELFNLPKIENNYAEGLVIKPVDYLTFPNNDRVILKSKPKKFSEKISSINIKKEKENTELDQVTVDLIKYAYQYINENRLNAVISKLKGPFTDKDFGKILGLFCKDINDDLEKDYPDLIKESKESGDYKYFQKMHNKTCSIFLRDNFIKLITTNYDE